MAQQLNFKNLDFNQLGVCTSFVVKMKRHLDSKNEERLKDYICAAYNTFNPFDMEKHPCYDTIIKPSIQFLREKGWIVYQDEWKKLWIQVIVISPTKRYYHSSFKYPREE